MTTTLPLTWQVFPSTFDRLAGKIYTRTLRLRARVRILTRCTKASSTRVKVAVIIGAVLVLGPWDVVLDPIPVVGQLFEVGVIAATVWYCKRHDPAVARAITHLFH